jgi:hypothetical protein
VTTLNPGSARDALSLFHELLDAHFRDLQEERRNLEGDAPTFALEHGLLPADLDDLKEAVRFVVSHGFERRCWQFNWLPFTVFAAEAGYAYSGDEFWPSFDRFAPGWATYGDRDHVRTWFTRFNTEYGGAVPKGAFARSFPIIAWPITHAVLPVYLQRNLARLLYEFRMGLTTGLLHQPEDLGTRLAARAREYTERFRIFCENTSLLGHLAVALLSGEEEPSPYLYPSTLHRVIEGLERESEAKFWLQGARSAASRVRTRGFQPGSSRGGDSVPSPERLPNPTDPSLILRAGDNGWRVFAQLPDLGSLSERLPRLYAELRAKRAHIEGAATIFAPSRLTMPGQEARLTRWPDPGKPFVRLEDGDAAVNLLIRDQVAITRGPTWLFKLRQRGVAVEVKSQLVRLGGVYYVVHDGSWSAPDVAWAETVALDAAGADAVRLDIPDRLQESESSALVAAGMSVAGDERIRPVGIAAREWNGEGAVEWLAGETGLLAIRAERIPLSLTIEMAGKLRTQTWPESLNELFLRVDDLPVGEHELRVTLRDSQQILTVGSLIVTIREPHARADTAEPGEGIRLLTSPARPTMSELWEPGTVSIAGPAGLPVDLHATLRTQDRSDLARIHRPVTPPLLESDWAGVAEKLRGNEQFARHFDEAESIEISISRAGIGYASLIADRGFQPLRWQLVRDRDINRARLIDHTDTASTKAEMYRFESPLVAVPCEPGADVLAPANGGLLRAVAGDDVDARATVLLPTQPNELMRARPTLPQIHAQGCSPAEIERLARGYQLWEQADLPGDVFARHQRDTVLESVTRAVVSLVAGSRWSVVEQRIGRSSDPLDLVEDMQAAVGGSVAQRQLAQTIGRRLYEWSDPVALLNGFTEIIQATLRSNGLGGHDSATRFLLILAGHCGQIMNWPDTERGFLLQQVIATPLLLRAARLAVLGTRFLNETGDERKGF